MYIVRAALAVVLLALLKPEARADFLNEYLDDKVFGPRPGPCPGPTENEACESGELNGQDLPASVGGIEFCLIDFGIFRICDPLSSWLRGGTAKIWNMQCEDLGVGTITLNEVSSSTSRISNRLSTNQVFQRCSGRTKLTDVTLQKDGFTVVLSLEGDFTTNPRGDGLDLAFDLEVFNDEVGGFPQNLVNKAEVTNCDLEIDLGLVMDTSTGSFDKLEVSGFNLSFLAGDTIANLVLRLVESIFGGTVCALFEQAGTLNDGNPGVLNTGLNELNTIYDDLIQPTTIDIAGDDAAFVANPENFFSNRAEQLASLNFATSPLVEVVSVTLNDFLGEENDQGQLKINEAIELLTNPPGFLELAGEGALDIEFLLPIRVADATISFEKFEIEGLNTIKTFGILDNEFGTGNELIHTLKHAIEIGEITFKITIGLLFERGEWVTESSCGTLNNFDPACTSDIEKFQFRFGLTMTDINFDAATLLAANFDELSDIKIGQIIGRDLSVDPQAALQQSLHCVAPSIYAFNFTNLDVSVGSITDAVVDNFSGPSLSQLIQQSTNLLMTLFTVVFKQDLPFISNGPFRAAVNEVLQKNVSNVEDFAECPPYEPGAPSADPYLKFNEPPVKNIFPVINDVLGNFDAGSSVDINDLVDTLLTHFSTTNPTFPLAEGATTGDWILKPEFNNIADLPPFKEAYLDLDPTPEAFIRISDLTLENVDSIHQLSANDNGPTGFNFDFTIGETNNELTFNIRIHVKVNVDGGRNFEENFVLNLILTDVAIAAGFEDVLINFDTINELTFGQLTHPPCLLSILDSIKVPSRTLSTTSVDFNMPSRTGTGTDNYRTAVATLESEFAGTPSLASQAMINSLLELANEVLWDGVENLNTSITPANCDSVDSTLGNILGIISAGTLPNVNELVEICLADPEDATIDAIDYAALEVSRMGPVENLGASYLDFADNFLIDLIASALDISGGGGDSSTLQRVLIGIANSTGNVLSDILTLEGDDIVVLELALNEENPLFKLLGLPPLTISRDGFTAEAQSIKIRGINKFLNDFSVFQPVAGSHFSTKSHIGFSEANPLAVEIVTFIQTPATFQGGLETEPPIEETINIDLELRGVQIDFALLTAINIDELLKLSVGHFFDVKFDQTFILADHAANCLFKLFFDGGVNIPFFTIDVSDITGPTVDATNNIISNGVEGMLREFTILLTEFYLTALPNICQNCVRTFVNDQVDALYESAQTTDACPADPQTTILPDSQKTFNVRDSQLIADLQSVLQESFYPNNFDLWNTIMKSLTEEALFTPEPLQTGFIDIVYKGLSYGQLNVLLDTMTISGLDTFSDLAILEPVAFSGLDSRYTTHNALTIDQLDINLNIDVVGKDLFVDFDKELVRNKVNVDIQFKNLTLVLDLYLEVDINKLLGMRFSSITSLEEIPCVFIPVQAMQIADFEFTQTEIVVAFECVIDPCDSPVLERTNTVGRLSSADDDELSELLNFVVLFTVDYIKSSPMQQLLDAQIATAEDGCANIINGIRNFFPTHEEDFNVFDIMAKAFGVALGIGALAVGLLFPIHKKRRGKVLESFTKKQHKFTVEQEVELLQDEMKSLFQHQTTPLFMKVFVPLFCVVNIIGLVIAILFSGALNIIITVTVLGMTTNTLVLVPFTVISTINDIWNSGAWPLALLIGIASCAWPVFKNAVLLILFFCPSTLISTHRRNVLLETLDIMGKWSFLDVFVVVMTLAALKTYVVLSDQSRLTFLDETFFVTDVNVQPERGIILLCIIAATSLVVNHIMAYYHAKSVAYNRRKFDRFNGNPEAVPAPALKKVAVEGYRFNARRVSKKAVYVLFTVNIISGLMAVIGVFLPLITFQLKGLVGLFLDTFDQGFTTRQFSVLSLGVIIGEAPKTNIGEIMTLYFFQILYFAVALIFPALQVLCIGVLLKKKFTLDNQKLMLTITMVVSFWAALECFLVGVVATIIEISHVTVFIIDFITGDACSDIKVLLELFVDEENGSCLAVEGILEPASIVIIVGAFVQLFCILFGAVLAHAVVQDRYYKAYVKSGLRPREAKPKKPGKMGRAIIKMMTEQGGRKKKSSIAVHQTFSANPANSVPTSPQGSQMVGNTNPMFTRTNSDDLFDDLDRDNEVVPSHISTMSDGSIQV